MQAYGKYEMMDYKLSGIARGDPPDGAQRDEEGFIRQPMTLIKESDKDGMFTKDDPRLPIFPHKGVIYLKIQQLEYDETEKRMATRNVDMAWRYITDCFVWKDYLDATSETHHEAVEYYDALPDEQTIALVHPEYQDKQLYICYIEVDLKKLAIEDSFLFRYRNEIPVYKVTAMRLFQVPETGKESMKYVERIVKLCAHMSNEVFNLFTTIGEPWQRTEQGMPWSHASIVGDCTDPLGCVYQNATDRPCRNHLPYFKRYCRDRDRLVLSLDT